MLRLPSAIWRPQSCVRAAACGILGCDPPIKTVCVTGYNPRTLEEHAEGRSYRSLFPANAYLMR